MESTETAAVALVADLMFASRVRGAAAAAGVSVVTVSRANEVEEEVRRLRPRLVLLDIDTRGAGIGGLIQRLKADPETVAAQIVVFGPHVDSIALLAAREAGADRVLARFAFVRDLPALLAP